MAKIEAGKMSAAEVAKEIGISVAGWYYRASKIRKGVSVKAPSSMAGKGNGTMPQGTRPVFDEQDIREGVEKLQTKGHDSLFIARELGISLKKVNQYWNHDAAIRGAIADGPSEPVRGI